MASNREQFIADLEAMTVLELKELVTALEEHFGVTAAAPVAVAVAGGYLAINGTITVGNIQSFIQYIQILLTQLRKKKTNYAGKENRILNGKLKAG